MTSEQQKAELRKEFDQVKAYSSNLTEIFEGHFEWAYSKLQAQQKEIERLNERIENQRKWMDIEATSIIRLTGQLEDRSKEIVECDAAIYHLKNDLGITRRQLQLSEAKVKAIKEAFKEAGGTVSIGYLQSKGLL